MVKVKRIFRVFSLFLLHTFSYFYHYWFLNFDWNSDSPRCDGDIPIYVGCYADDGDRDFTINKGNGYDKSSCNSACKDYTYFGLQNGGECWCGNAYGTESKYIEKQDSACGGAEGNGGSWSNSVYETCVNSGEYAHFA